LSQEDEDDPARLNPEETPIIEELTDEDLSVIYNHFQVKDDDSDYEFEKIVYHKWKDGILISSAYFQGAMDDGHVMEVPFPVLKNNIPLELRDQPSHTLWANKLLKQHGRTSCRLARVYSIRALYQCNRNRRAKLNQHTAQPARITRNNQRQTSNEENQDTSDQKARRELGQPNGIASGYSTSIVQVSGKQAYLLCMVIS
jgi:hypothetical protein